MRVWQRPDCAACFQEETDVNGEWELKNTTGEFFRRFAEYANCREGHFPNATDVCRECRPPYDNTKRFFCKSRSTDILQLKSEALELRSRYVS